MIAIIQQFGIKYTLGGFSGPEIGSKESIFDISKLNKFDVKNS